MHKQSFLQQILLSFLCFFIAPTSYLFAASFHCDKTKISIEKIICSNETISNLDSTLATTYKRALQSIRDGTSPSFEQQHWFKEIRKKCEGHVRCIQQEHEFRLLQATNSLKHEQRAWLKQKRNKCHDIVCLQATYTKRILTLDPLSDIPSSTKKITATQPIPDIKTLFMILPDEAFAQGVDHLSIGERQQLIHHQQNNNYTLTMPSNHEWIIQHKDANDIFFSVRLYTAEQNTILCVNTSNGYDESVKCWQGTEELKPFQSLSVTDFFYQEGWRSLLRTNLEQQGSFSTSQCQYQPNNLEEILKQYPVQMTFVEDGLQAYIKKPWSPPTYRIHYQWHSHGHGSFDIQKTREDKVVIFIEPDQTRMLAIEADYGENMMDLMDDVMHYKMEAKRFISNLNISSIDIKQKTFSFNTHSTNKTYDWSAINKDWFIVIFNGNHKPIISDYMAIYQYQSILQQ